MEREKISIISQNNLKRTIYWILEVIKIGKIIFIIFIICLNLNLSGKNNNGIPNLDSVKGDGRKLEFDDSEFDIVFSNSVIEHVGSFEDQKKICEEILRVGKKFWVQTPSKSFFFEPHFLFPFFHWFPISIRKIIVYITPWYLISKPNKDKIEVVFR